MSMPPGLVDPFGRNMDIGVLSWMVTGAPDNRLYTLMCRHADTSHVERGSGESEGVVLSRLIEEHHTTANKSEFSYRGKWLCFCEPHKAPS